MHPDALLLPSRSLIALCGPAGAGKSTFVGDILAHNRLPPTAAVTSDRCRLMLCDETSTLSRGQWASLQPATVQLFLTIIEMRLRIGHCTIADGVNLHADLRTGMLAPARHHAYHTVLIVFDLPLEMCLTQNAQRDGSRRIPEQQIRAQREALDEIMPRLSDEGWDHVIVLNTDQRSVRLEIAP